MTLKTVAGTSATRDLTVADTSKSISSMQNVFVWFQVTMDVEFWKNCNFTSCPNVGSYFCQTACRTGGFPNKTEFVGLTSRVCGSGLLVKAMTGSGWSATSSTTVEECGPIPGCTDNYWNTGAVPSSGGCLSDLLATNLGISNGCNGSTPFGRAAVLWRFQ